MRLPWSDIPVFLAVARNGSLSAAARTLKLDRTTVSRRIENMENTLGRKLFERKDGRFDLSQVGMKMFVAAECAEQELSVLGTLLQTEKHTGGKLRVSMSEHLLITLADCFKDFASEQPNILLELTAIDRQIDLHHFEADVAIRVCREISDDLSFTKIGKPTWFLYRKVGHTDIDKYYLSRPSEQNVPSYLRSIIPNATIVIAIGGLVSMREMIANGTGVGILPSYFGNRDSRIEQCSNPLPSAGASIYLAYLPEQRRLHRLSIFVDYVEQYLRSLGGFEKSSTVSGK